MFRRRILMGLLPLIVLGSGLAVPAQRAFACTPPPGGLPQYTLADLVNAAPIVFEGTVVSNLGPSDGQYDVQVQVIEVLKGSAEPVVRIGSFGTSALCLTSVTPGETYIFFAAGEGAQLRAYYLSQGTAVARSSPEALAAIRDIMNGQPAPMTEDESSEWSMDLFPLSGLCMNLLFGVTGSIGIVCMAFRRRKG